MQQHTRAIGTALLAMLVLAACGGDDRVASAADAICDAIDSEPSDEVAFEEYELALARERRDGMDEDELRAALDQRCGRAIAAISAAAKSQDEEEVEETEPEPEQVDVREIDWTDQPWPTDCTDGLGQVEATLSREESEAGLGDVLAFTAVQSDVAPVTFTVFLESAAYGDLSGAGNVDAAFITDCFYGNHAGRMVEVWRLDGDGQLLHERLLEYTKFDGQIEELEARDGALRIHTAEGLPGDDTPHLNGYPIEVVTDWSFDGDEWSPVEVERSAPEPEPAPEPAIAECVDPGSTPEAASLCLRAAAQAGDFDTGAAAAGPDALRFMRESSDWGADFNAWQFDGCGAAGYLLDPANFADICTFYDPPQGEIPHGVTIEFGLIQGSDRYYVAQIETVG